MMTMPSAAL